MTRSNAAHDVPTSVPTWNMPILLESYPHRDPSVTDEEAALMKRYMMTPMNEIAGQAKGMLEQLQRFDRPFLDTIQLRTKSDKPVARSRRHLFKYMVQTRTAFWSWSKETWAEVIQSIPEARPHNAGIWIWMITLAYLFSDFLYVDALTPYTDIAYTLFGKDRVDEEVDKLYTPLTGLGYSQQPQGKWRFRRLCTLVMLVNKSPSAEALSAQVIVTINDLLTRIPDKSRTEGQRELIHLQASLCHLGIIDEPAILASKSEQLVFPPPSWQSDTTVDPTWLAWISAFYEQTPHRTARTFRNVCYHLLTAGRWLKKVHPEISDPTEWDESLAAEYLAYTCQALRGDQMSLKNGLYATYQATPQKLGPAGIDHRLSAMRCFFSHLQRRAYTVQGKHYPKLQLTWLPSEAFKTPDAIRAAIQPNPRDIQEDIWFKLIWTACTLSKEQLDAAGTLHFPLAYYRAASLIWVTAARRSDEIRRLSVGCVSREWAPEMCDEHGQPVEPATELCYIRVPTNKMKGEFYIPVPSYVADAIEVWESVRPPNQKMLEDRKTHKPTSYLFQYRNEQMGRTFLNDSTIPLLCKLAGVSQTDIVGRITSHRARATTATWMRKMGMAPTDIGKLLGHTNPAKSLPWYLREDKHHLGRAYRKANPLERYVAAILDTNAHAKQEPCVFYYLTDGPDGRPRMCGNPHFSRCIHQLMCIECEAFIDHELAEAIEKREGAIVISVPIPLPPQMVAELNEQDEAGCNAPMKLEDLPPPTLPGPAFHFNKKVPLRLSPTTSSDDVNARLQQIETQIAKKQGKVDQRSAAMQALLRERAELQVRPEVQERQFDNETTLTQPH